MKGLHVSATILLTGCALLASGCGDRPSPQDTQTTQAGTPAPSASLPDAAPSPPAASAAADAWLGQWNGPEGTFLKIEGGAGQYDVTVRNLDGPRTFKGRAQGDTLVFTRDGLQETLHATDGAATGMKWLQGKRDCLTVKTGEGYCRD